MEDSDCETKVYRKISSPKERRITAHLSRVNTFYYLKRCIEDKRLTVFMCMEEIKAMSKEE